MSLRYTVMETLPSFAEVVENVRNGHPDGLDQLYSVFRILSASLRRQIGYQDFDDRVHDMFIVVVEAIRDGKLREPGALPSYIHGVARLSLCSKIGVKTRHDRLSGSLAALGDHAGIGSRHPRTLWRNASAPISCGTCSRPCRAESARF